MGICKLDRLGSIHRRIDLRCFAEREEAAALLHCTGSGDFNRFVSRVALEQGYTLSEMGIRKCRRESGGVTVAIGPYLDMPNELAIFDFLGLQYVEPADRRNKMSVIRKATGLPWYHREPRSGAAHALLEPKMLALPAPSDTTW